VYADIFTSSVARGVGGLFEFVSSGQLSLLPSAGWEMSSSYSYGVEA